MSGLLIARIVKIILETEEIQESHESAYTKEQAKISAYDDIADLFADLFKRSESE